MSDTTTTPAERAIYLQAKGGREAAERLLPLLRLLETNPGDDDPAAQLLTILQSILTTTREVHARLDQVFSLLMAQRAPSSDVP
jgi:hypothetical protein